MLGRYALYEKIASGGMASVHLGRLLGPVGFARTVAIKRMHPQFSEDPEFVSMFLDEARLAARIRHPHVVPTIDVVAMAGELFLVMDFVQGESLSRLIRAAKTRGERIPPEIVAAMMVGALHGLHAAHEAKSDRGEPLGIVHRDVSPHNILVGTDGVARVLDFGVAKAVGRLQTTREGQLKGKLAYMAPEQVRGEVTRVTDVYSASVVLWEALTGKRLFFGDNEAQVLDQLLRGTRVPPSKHVRGLPSALDKVTMRGLNVDPGKRFATAREMALALEHAIPPATASTIGDWVEMAAKETLDERSARIFSIESDSSVQAPAMPPPSPSSPSSRSGPYPASMSSSPSGRAIRAALGHPVDEIPTTSDDMMLTQLSSGSVSSPGRPSLLGTPRGKAWLVVAVAGVAIVAAVVLAGSWRSEPPAPAISLLPTVASSPVVPPPSATVAASASSDIPTVSISDLAAGSATSARPSPVRRLVRGPAWVAPPPPAPPASGAAKPAYNPLEHL
jgi:eukaryotic-like serine/threonine-protein kinase